MHPLDNVIWSALTTRQAHLGTRDRAAAKFDPEVSVFGALEALTADAWASLIGLVAPGGRVALVIDGAVPPPQLAVISDLSVLQMLRDTDAPLAATGPDRPAIAPLTAADVPAMTALSELTKPGPFNRRTREMGDYFGLRSGDQLIAMAGERLRVPGFTEISAICTHPDHLGRGYAAAFIELLVGRILARGERPFLHVLPQNTRAVALYERLGFRRRHEKRYLILERVS